MNNYSLQEIRNNLDKIHIFSLEDYQETHLFKYHQILHTLNLSYIIKRALRKCLAIAKLLYDIARL